jgi:hypothetical protein
MYVNKLVLCCEGKFLARISFAKNFQLKAAMAEASDKLSRRLTNIVEKLSSLFVGLL